MLFYALMFYSFQKGEYCLDLAATTTIFLSLVHWNVINKNDLNEVQIGFALHWGHFCQWHFNVHWIQGLRKLLLLLPVLNNTLPFRSMLENFRSSHALVNMLLYFCSFHSHYCYCCHWFYCLQLFVFCVCEKLFVKSNMKYLKSVCCLFILILID